VFGRLARLGALARFSRNLAVLVDAGVPFVDALPIAASTAGNRVLELSALSIAANVRNGASISAGMAEEPIFTDVVVQMVAAGEESGAVDVMLQKIADMYELEVETTVDSLTSLLEPLLIAVMAMTVGGILLAVYLPMFKAVSLVK
jgi:type IV pilus assembly protein PilC